MTMNYFEQLGLREVYADTLRSVEIECDDQWLPYYVYVELQESADITQVRLTLGEHDDVHELTQLLDALPKWATSHLTTQYKGTSGQIVLIKPEPIAVVFPSYNEYRLACQNNQTPNNPTSFESEPESDIPLTWTGPLEDSHAETTQDPPDDDASATGGPPTKQPRRVANDDPAASSSKAHKGSKVPPTPNAENPTPGGIPRISATLVSYGVSTPSSKQEAPDATHVGTSLRKSRRGGTRRDT